MYVYICTVYIMNDEYRQKRRRNRIIISNDNYNIESYRNVFWGKREVGLVGEQGGSATKKRDTLSFKLM